MRRLSVCKKGEGVCQIASHGFYQQAYLLKLEENIVHAVVAETCYMRFEPLDVIENEQESVVADFRRFSIREE